MNLSNNGAINDLLMPIYIEAGKGLIDCQRFEYGIGLLIYFLSTHGLIDFEAGKAIAILDNEEKMTAGRLISLLKKKASVSLELDKILEDGLRARNQLAHRVLIENTKLMINPEKTDELVRKIRNLRKLIMASHEKIQPLIKELAISAGVEIEEITSDIKELMARHT